MTENLVIVAHPDDETLWFGATILSRPEQKWTVVCVTDSRDPAIADRRRQELKAACAALGVAEVRTWGLPDEPLARLPMARLRERLAEIDPARFHRVWTHGPSGEYGHWHHQDVGFAVHQAGISRGLKVSSVAYHSVAEEVVTATPDIYRRKMAILTSVYGGEFFAFAHLLPSFSVEGFSIIRDAAEAELVYSFHAGRLGLAEVRAQAARAGLTAPVHPWLAGDSGVSPPCPSETYSLLAAADNLLGRLPGGAWSGRSGASAPERLAEIGESAGLWDAVRRVVMGPEKAGPEKSGPGNSRLSPDGI